MKRTRIGYNDTAIAIVVLVIIVALVWIGSSTLEAVIVPGGRTTEVVTGTTSKVYEASVTTTASGNTSGFDTEGFTNCAFAGVLDTLVGGTAPTVQLATETSPNDFNWFTIANVGTSMNAVAQQREDRTTRLYHRFVRFIWTTTGTPTSSTATIYARCAR